jgi:Rrf2 family protein
MISKTAEYALRAIVFLAEMRGEPCTAQVIAQRTKVPAGYLAKVMQSLSRAGVVNSQRGLNGGFTLSKPPSELSVYEVVQAVDPFHRITECPLGIPEHRSELCALHRRLDEATALVERSFKETMIADMLTKPILIGASR